MLKNTNSRPISWRARITSLIANYIRSHGGIVKSTPYNPVLLEKLADFETITDPRSPDIVPHEEKQKKAYKITALIQSLCIEQIKALHDSMRQYMEQEEHKQLGMYKPQYYSQLDRLLKTLNTDISSNDFCVLQKHLDSALHTFDECFPRRSENKIMQICQEMQNYIDQKGNVNGTIDKEKLNDLSSELNELSFFIKGLYDSKIINKQFAKVMDMFISAYKVKPKKLSDITSEPDKKIQYLGDTINLHKEILGIATPPTALLFRRAQAESLSTQAAPSNAATKGDEDCACQIWPKNVCSLQ